MSTEQTDRIHARTAATVARMRADADTADTRGDHTGAAALRTLADSRERTGQHAHVGARIGQA